MTLSAAIQFAGSMLSILERKSGILTISVRVRVCCDDLDRVKEFENMIIRRSGLHEDKQRLILQALMRRARVAHYWSLRLIGIQQSPA
jgi:hypothetical protein